MKRRPVSSLTTTASPSSSCRNHPLRMAKSKPTPSMTTRDLLGAQQSQSQQHVRQHSVHVDSNPGLFPGFPNLNFNFLSDDKPKKEIISLDKKDEGGGEPPHDDWYNFALLLALYTIQGIPMGLSASIPFLIQQKVNMMSTSNVAAALSDAASTSSGMGLASSKVAYSAQAIFALCSWPFSLKLLWAPIVDSVFSRRFGRRKSWLVPSQALAGLLMVVGSGYVERQLGLSGGTTSFSNSFDVKGVTAFFFTLYFLMATQDIAVDGWALTMLSKKNRPKGPICNSIGQNIGYFFSFVGFLALNDPESSENIWRPLFGMQSRPGVGLVSLGSFVKYMGIFMLVVTTLVAIFKKEESTNGSSVIPTNNSHAPSRFALVTDIDTDEEAELDASKIGLRETYHRLYAVCQLPAVRWLFVILLTYRLPVALSDNVKFLKAVEFGLGKQTTALLSPMIVLPLGIAVPIIAAKWWKGHPLRQFMTAYEIRVTLVPLIDTAMLLAVKSMRNQHDIASQSIFWSTLIISTAMQATIQSLQFNAQMTFFASRVDPAIGGSYMTLLNTAANLGGTWPASFVMYLVGSLTVPPTCTLTNGVEKCTGELDRAILLFVLFSQILCMTAFIIIVVLTHTHVYVYCRGKRCILSTSNCFQHFWTNMDLPIFQQSSTHLRTSG